MADDAPEFYSAFWDDLADDWKDPEFREEFIRQIALCENNMSAVRGESKRPQDLSSILNLAARVIRSENVWGWMLSPNATLDGATPLGLVTVGERERVVDLLAAMAEGVTD